MNSIEVKSLVKKYNKSLSDLPIITPEFPRHLKSANHLYVIQLKKNKKKNYSKFFVF